MISDTGVSSVINGTQALSSEESQLSPEPEPLVGSREFSDSDATVLRSIVTLSEQQQQLATQQQQLVAQQKLLLEKLEGNQSATRTKDHWDRIAAVAPVISAVIIALGGAWFTAIYNQQQLKLQEIQTIEKFFPHLTGDEKSKRAAILAISSLGDAKLASKVAAIFASEGTVSALEQIAKHADSGDRNIATGALARALDSMGANYEADKKFDDAVKAYQRALAMREQAYGASSARVLPSLNQLIEVHKLMHDYADAETLLQRALAIQSTTYGAESPQVAYELRRLAALYELQGAMEKCRATSARAAQIEDKTRGSTKPKAPSDTGEAPVSPDDESSDPSLPGPRQLEQHARGEDATESSGQSPRTGDKHANAQSPEGKEPEKAAAASASVEQRTLAPEH